MSTVRITTVVGARPQFIKAATVSRAIAAFNASSGGSRVEDDLYGDGHSAEKIVAVLAGVAGR